MKYYLMLAGLLLAVAPAWADRDATPESASHVPLTIQARLEPDQVSNLDKALADAGDNAPQLTSALDMLEGSLFDDAVFLITHMPHLDRLEMTRDVLTHHVIYADLARQVFPWPVPDSLYRQFILTYRLDQEPISDWRADLWPVVKARAKRTNSTEAFVRGLNEWIAANFQEQESEFFGGQQTPEQTLAAQRGTRKEIASLTTALLKTAGIPSRRVSVGAFLGQSGGAQWTEVFIAAKGQWLPLYPQAPQHFGDYSWWEPDSMKSNVSYAQANAAFEALDVTSAYTATGEIEIHFTRVGAPISGFDGFTINVFNQGAFIAIDELETVADSIGIYRCRLGEGRYWIISGTRDATGSPFVCMQPVEISPDSTVRLTMDLTPGMYVSSAPKNLQSSEVIPLFEITDAAGRVRSSREAVGNGALLILLLRPNHEPSIRMTDLIQSWLAKLGDQAPKSLWIMEGAKGSGGTDWAYDPEGKIGELFSLKGTDDYPLVLWVDKEGKLAQSSKGYNLNIATILDGNH
jgi:hypothetical protein